VKRRDFVVFLSGAAIGWPMAASTQQTDRIRRIGIMMQIPETDHEAQARISALVQGLRQFGWTLGRNLQIDYRGTADNRRIPSLVSELIASAPEVILAVPTRNVQELQRQTRTIPIVFVNIGDPVTTGLVPNLSHPGGNITGFLGTEASLAGKWLQLLKEIAPNIDLVLVLANSAELSNQAYLTVIEHVAQSLGVRVSSSVVTSAEEIYQAMSAVARQGKAGLVALPGGPITVHRKAIFAAAVQYRLPAVYAFGYYALEGGLMSYGTDVLDQWRRAASYVDRILRGERAGDLPVQAPTKFRLVVNATSAKAIGLTIPQSMLHRADEVVE
jgi:putative ABC transport system substrate-binding protein